MRRHFRLCSEETKTVGNWDVSDVIIEISLNVRNAGKDACSLFLSSQLACVKFNATHATQPTQAPKSANASNENENCINVFKRNVSSLQTGLKKSVFFLKLKMLGLYTKIGLESTRQKCMKKSNTVIRRHLLLFNRLLYTP